MGFPEGKADIIRIIEEDDWMFSILKMVHSLKLADWWIGAGFVRNKVWDFIHGYKNRTQFDDVDVIYYNKSDTKKSIDRDYERKLYDIYPKISWSVKNQARMHLRNDDEQYQSIFDALSHWTETATCIAITLDGYNRISIMAPYGVSDLINLIVRPTHTSSRYLSLYEKRIREKNWQAKWPMLEILRT